MEASPQPDRMGPLRRCWQVCLIALSAVSISAVAATPAETGARPDILVVLVDDAALMDFGAYGGEAATPNIDALAARGVRFDQYRTSPLCAPSRAMLLTGMDNHLTGVATIPEVLPAEHRGKAGYSMRLEPGVQTIATRLRELGYHTLMTGKWHLGHGRGALPNAQGFDRSFALDASGADNWEQKPYMPYYQHADWFEDGQPASLPQSFYSSEFLVDRMLDYLNETPPAQPVFAYLALQAIHIPVQAPAEFTAHYVDTYQDGWEALRERRFARARALGLVPESAALASPPKELRPWGELDTQERALAARRMAVNAGMLEALDHHLGRLLEGLSALGRLDNTIIIVTSDNGPEPSDPVSTAGFGTWLWLNGYSLDIDTLGERGSYTFIGPEWAFAAATPSNLFKFYAAEGGIRVPLVMAGPGIPAAKSIRARAFVTDLAPTLLDYAGVSNPPNEMTGRTLRPLMDDRQSIAYRDDEVVGLEVSGNAALFRGRFKLLRNLPPWGTGDWQLFDLAEDPGETRDLATTHPEIVAELRAAYADYAESHDVLEVPADYNYETAISRNTTRRIIAGYRGQLFAGTAIFIGLAVMLLRRRSRRQKQ